MLSANTVRRGPREYRHDPYGARLIAPIEPMALCPSPTAHTSASPSCALTDVVSEAPSYELTPVASGAACVVRVSFKYGERSFASALRVRPGEAVVTEGDRGEDLGFAQRVEGLSCGGGPAASVLRVATREDRHAHLRRAHKEREALYTIRTLAKQVKCAAFIQDIMYQLDGRKITVIIARDSRAYVDFRRLQRAAYEVFRCRVWCAYLDEITAPEMGGEMMPPPHRVAHGRRAHGQLALPAA